MKSRGRKTTLEATEEPKRPRSGRQEQKSTRPTWSPTPINQLEDQLVDIQLIQVGDVHDLDLEKRAIAQQLVDLVKALGSYLK